MLHPCIHVLMCPSVSGGRGPGSGGNWCVEDRGRFPAALVQRCQQHGNARLRLCTHLGLVDSSEARPDGVSSMKQMSVMSSTLLNISRLLLFPQRTTTVCLIMPDLQTSVPITTGMLLKGGWTSLGSWMTWRWADCFWWVIIHCDFYFLLNLMDFMPFHRHQCY